MVGTRIYKGKEVSYRERMPFYSPSQSESRKKTQTDAAKRVLRIIHKSANPYAKGRIKYQNNIQYGSFQKPIIRKLIYMVMNISR